jgi:hypothetical protein
MANIAELTAAYTNLLLRPEPGPDVCELCWNLTDGYRRCYACARSERWLAAVTPISYSVAHEQLHLVLAGYKRWPAELAAQAEREIAAVLWRHLLVHESCHATAAGVVAFDVVTTVPGGTPERDRDQPLRRIVGDTIEPTRSRYRRLLVRSEVPVTPRTDDPERFTPTAPLDGEAVLLIDDTWTSGASAQSAAAALLSAGAGSVAALVIGRHVNRDWRGNDRHLRDLARPFDWDRCVHCAAEVEFSPPRPPAAQIRS